MGNQRFLEDRSAWQAAVRSPAGPRSRAALSRRPSRRPPPAWPVPVT